MRVPLVLVSVAIVIAVAVFGRVDGDAVISEDGETHPEVNSSDVKGEADEIAEEVDGTQIPTPTVIPTSNPTPQDIPQPSYSNSEYVFPGASVISDSGSELILQSNSGTDEITEWYRNKLKSLGLNVNTTVKTKANDKVLNKLAASGADTSVGVEISKEDGGTLVTIVVTF